MSSPPLQPNPYAPPVTPAPLQGMPPPGSEQFAPCPQCRCPYAKRIKWTFWGGALGPWMFTHVRCTHCGSAYNGKTGQWNTNNIVVYMLVGVLVGLALGVAVVLVPILMK